MVLFSTACRCRCYSTLARLPGTTRVFSAATTPPPPPPPPSSKFDRRRLKAASVVTLTGILAGLYYEYALNGSSSTSLNTITFTSYTLTSKTPITSGPTQTTIFTLSPPSSTPPPQLPFSTGILSIQIKQPQLQIARSYTPLPPCQNAELRFLIKREPGGEMSRYLYSLKEGDVVEVRGPDVEYIYPLQEDRKIVFFAGGTGIAPAIQVAESLLLQNGEGKVMEAEILWAVRHKEEAFGGMKEEISSLVERVKAAGNGRKLVVRKFVDSEGGIKIQDVETAIATKDKRTSRVFVSGPEGFVAWIAGPKDFGGGREKQGALGGLLKAATQSKGCDIEVFKL